MVRHVSVGISQGIVAAIFSESAVFTMTFCIFIDCRVSTILPSISYDL